MAWHVHIRFLLRGCFGGLSTSILLLGQAEAGMIRAASVSFADVKAAVSSARDGDTVALPAGEASWTQPLVITRPITLQGKTVVSGDHSTWTASLASNPAFIPAVSRKTIIHHAVLSGDKGGLIQLTPPAGAVSGLWRVTGISFLPPSSGRPLGAVICPKALLPNFRVDHCEFDGLANTHIWAWNEKGLVDHNVAVHGTQIFFHHKPMTWGGMPSAAGDRMKYNSRSLGDGSWAADLNAGDAGGNRANAERKVYLEDNFFRPGGGPNELNGATRGFSDGESGARFVCRYNIGFSTAFENHGAESSFNRSGRMWEIYNNQLYSRKGITKGAATFWRGGTGFIFNNHLSKLTNDASSYGSIGNTVNYRFNGNRSWGPASGKNGWDLNDDGSGGGTSAAGHVYFSGTATSDNVSTLVDSRANFLTSGSGLQGYSCLNATTGGFGAIISNTATSCQLTVGSGPKPGWRIGDKYEIRRVWRALDQPGAGKDASPLPPGHPKIAPRWPNQAIEPIYVWGNTLNGNKSDLGNRRYPTTENLDYFNENSAFNGSKGIGIGPLAQRPTTCSPGKAPGTGSTVPGVGYWATDQGEWDSTHPGPDGQLYVCTAPNTWTLYYKPYTYPHPLTTGSLTSGTLSSSLARVLIASGFR